jgi:hypothetical protein
MNNTSGAHPVPRVRNNVNYAALFASRGDDGGSDEESDLFERHDSEPGIDVAPLRTPDVVPAVVEARAPDQVVVAGFLAALPRAAVDEEEEAPFRREPSPPPFTFDAPDATESDVLAMFSWAPTLLGEQFPKPAVDKERRGWKRFPRPTVPGAAVVAAVEGEEESRRKENGLDEARLHVFKGDKQTQCALLWAMPRDVVVMVLRAVGLKVNHCFLFSLLSYAFARIGSASVRRASMSMTFVCATAGRRGNRTERAW